MLRILVAGAGHIGQLIAELLAATGDYRVTVVDRDELALTRLRGVPGVDTLCASVTDQEAMVAALQGCFAVLSAAPYAVTGAVAQAAHATIVVTGVFTNAGAAGAGSTALATFTNDSDLADSTTQKSAAWVAHDALEIITNARPGSPTSVRAGPGSRPMAGVP